MPFWCGSKPVGRSVAIDRETSAMNSSTSVSTVRVTRSDRRNAPISVTLATAGTPLPCGADGIIESNAAGQLTGRCHLRSHLVERVDYTHLAFSASLRSFRKSTISRGPERA